MRAFAATGDQAEALNAFRRCRELLSIVLGIKPSAETDQLYREIAAGERPVSRPYGTFPPRPSAGALLVQRVSAGRRARRLNRAASANR